MVWRGPRGGGAGPDAGDRPEPPWRIPAAQGLGAGPQLVAHAPQTPPGPVRDGQGAPASTGSRGPPAHRGASRVRA